MLIRRIIGSTLIGLVALVVIAILVWRGDILRSGLDPEMPFQTYEPPPAADYAEASAWALRDAGREDGAAVFFIHSTTYDGGDHWNAPVDQREAEIWLNRSVLPNHAALFARSGALSVPRYRQASLYTRLTIREDAREARAFAYQDISAAFDAWLARNPDGPIIIAGVEQGGELAARLLREQVGPNEVLRARLVAAYLMDSAVPADEYEPDAPLPACRDRAETGCVFGWVQIREMDEDALRRLHRRAMGWSDRGGLELLGSRPYLCVNPVLGARTDRRAEMREHLGGANATDLEWGVRPAFLTRQVSAQCQDGVLRYSRSASDVFRPTGSWADRRKAPSYNLFYADLEADVERRLHAWRQSADGRSARQSNNASST
ncbi:MAG: DUF3089 domain-containing protein [Brevundimonas sp.]|uniref:DUF3089 domain-containing protein n=1 Tax=Brevundimonas sp. TaxID=1871086 RepID=UPI00391B49AC